MWVDSPQRLGPILLWSVIQQRNVILEKRWDISAKLGSGPPPDTIVCPIDRAEMVLVPTGLDFVVQKRSQHNSGTIEFISGSKTSGATFVAQS